MIRYERDYVLGKREFPLKKKGNRGKLVKLIQEWLCLNNLPVVIDGIYGAATEKAVGIFQVMKGIFDTGKTDNKTFSVLTTPMRKVLKIIYVVEKSVCEIVESYARLHLKQHPREVGGQNKGPWVRLYMNGLEGRAYPWCAGFVSFIIRQSYEIFKLVYDPEWHLYYTVYAPNFAIQAKRKKLFIKGTKGVLRPGYIFLQKSKKGYSHCGFVASLDSATFKTIEGNTNDDGSAEGYEVCSRIRSYKNKDFVVIK